VIGRRCNSRGRSFHTVGPITKETRLCIIVVRASVIVIVNSRFLQRPQKRSRGNQLVHRRWRLALGSEGLANQVRTQWPSESKTELMLSTGLMSPLPSILGYRMKWPSSAFQVHTCTTYYSSRYLERHCLTSVLSRVLDITSTIVSSNLMNERRIVTAQDYMWPWIGVSLKPASII